MPDLNAFSKKLSVPKKIVLLPHTKPDADALGSALALSLYFKKKRHESTVISATNYPKFLFWMEGNKDVIIYNNNNKEKVKRIIDEANLIFCVDLSDLKRVGDLQEILPSEKEKFAIIDHHRDKQDFAALEFWDINASSTAELVYNFIELSGDADLINLSIAACIYAGMMTDTGSFKHPNTSARTHRIAAKLLDLGLDTSKIHWLIHDSCTENRLKFLGYALNKKLVVLPEYKTAYFTIINKEVKDFKIQTGDTEGLVNYALSIEGINMAVLFKEQDGKVKMSFRSYGDFSVSEFAKAYFGGGGHKNAAGGMLEMPLEKVIKLFNKLLPNYKQELLIS